ncbi:putative inactive purple acid phosphatase 2 [Iris pallida]|uniref:Purple acid phosphatase n=1 Tax=Iris pallida TaxID=29817 RepID=A0AAX6HSP7_IRIPA|nr:putative inactive purple acid phosphatase 2 [Iris pallida]
MFPPKKHKINQHPLLLPRPPPISPAMASSKTLTLIFLLLFLPISISSHVSISVSPKTLTRSNRTVTIQWSGVDSPSDLDWLGIYSPPSSGNRDFIGYLFLNASSTWATGSGSVSLPLVNLRSNYSFRIFRWSRSEVNPRHHDHDQNPLPGTKHRLAESESIGFENPGGPEQVHLAFTDRAEEMRVMWITGERSENWVRYGVEEGRLGNVEKATVGRYERGDMCDFPANASLGWRDPGWIQDGVMKGLEKGRKYYYQVGSDKGGWSDIHSFISRDNDANETIAFLFGDMGTAVPYSTFYRTQDESRSTVKWILHDLESIGDKPVFISHIGDISYARGFSWIWDEFFNQIEPIASRVPYHVCIGNHEYDWPLQPWKPLWAAYGKDGGGECGIPYSLKFKMPGKSFLSTGTGAPDTRNLYYSFDAGVVHFLYLSTETNFLKGSDQYNFIKADLENVNRDKTPFVVVQGHRPMYTTSNEVWDAALREKMLEHLEPLLVANNVTLALWGHVHRYERFCPMKNYKCEDVSSNFTYGGSPVHLVIGMAGQDWQPIWEPRSDHQDVPIFPQPERSMYRGGEFGYTRLVATREKLTLTYIGNHDGEMHDMVEILSGKTLNSTSDVAAKVDDEVGAKGGGEDAGKSKFSHYLKPSGILLLGAFVGYFLGFITRCRRRDAPRNTWTPVKSEET